MATKHPTTIRLDDQLHKEAIRQAEKVGLNLSSVIHMLLNAYVEGNVQIGVTQYPKKYLETLEKEADQLRKQNRKEKVKTYSSAKGLFDDILDR